MGCCDSHPHDRFFRAVWFYWVQGSNEAQLVAKILPNRHWHFLGSTGATVKIVWSCHDLANLHRQVEHHCAFQAPLSPIKMSPFCTPTEQKLFLIMTIERALNYCPSRLILCQRRATHDSNRSLLRWIKNCGSTIAQSFCGWSSCAVCCFVLCEFFHDEIWCFARDKSAANG